jgi:hypothetical protein
MGRVRLRVHLILAPGRRDPRGQRRAHLPRRRHHPAGRSQRWLGRAAHVSEPVSRKSTQGRRPLLGAAYKASAPRPLAGGRTPTGVTAAGPGGGGASRWVGCAHHQYAWAGSGVQRPPLAVHHAEHRPTSRASLPCSDQPGRGQEAVPGSPQEQDHDHAEPGPRRRDNLRHRRGRELQGRQDAGWCENGWNPLEPVRPTLSARVARSWGRSGAPRQ